MQDIECSLYVKRNPRIFCTMPKFFGTPLEICGNHAEAQIVPTPDLGCTKYLIHDLSIEILQLLINWCCKLLFFSMGLDVFNPAEPGMEGAVHIYTIFTKGGLSRELSPNPSLLVLLLGSSLFCQHHEPHICFHCHNRYYHHHQRHHQYHLLNPPHTLNIFFITGNLEYMVPWF